MSTNYEPRTTNPVIKTPDSSGACLSFMRPSPAHNPQPTAHTPNSDALFPFLRHPQPFFAANPLIMSTLLLCPKKGEISGPLRHRLSHNPHPTTYNPARYYRTTPLRLDR